MAHDITTTAIQRKKRKASTPLAHDVEMCARLHEMSDRTERALRASLAPKGAFGLSKLADKRRLAYGIPNGAFSVQPTYDTVYVYQLARNDGIAFKEGGLIVRPDMVQAQEVNESPRGILVAAGLEALDALRSHAIEIGHIVRLLRLSPYRMWVENVDGHDFHVLVMNAGDIRGSEDVNAQLRSGELRIDIVTETVNGLPHSRHVYVGGKRRKRGMPVSPWIPDDY